MKLPKLGKPSIVLHGGAGRWNVPDDVRRRALEVLKSASEHGYKLMVEGASAVEAVVEAVAILEDSQIFNAGMGSVLNALGEVEMDAGVMDGSTGRAGAVAAVKYPRNPIRLAKLVMEKTDHVLIVGSGADRLAKAFGLEPRIGIPPHIAEKYRELSANPDRVRYWRKLKEILKLVMAADTVGAVALDTNGNLAAAASTGGIWLKLPGRVGDSPIPGAGFYASRVAAASATGLGEVIVMAMATRRVVELREQGIDIGEACARVVAEITRIYGSDNIGIVALDVDGEAAADHNTEAMPIAALGHDVKEVIALFRARP